MRLPAGPDVDEFVELRFKPGSWEKNGVPEEGCRIRKSALDKMVASGGGYEPDDLILGLMDWLDVTDHPAPAVPMLRQMLDRHYPPNDRGSGRCRFVDEAGVDRLFHVGPIDLSAPLVAWQRRDWVIALAQPAIEPGRIVVAAPQPLSLNTALRMLSISMLNYMGEPFDSFVGAQTSAGSTAAFYSWDQGAVTTTRWDEGLDEMTSAGLGQLGSDRTEMNWLAPNQLAMQVAIAAGYLK